MEEPLEPSEKEKLTEFQEGFNEGLMHPLPDSLKVLLKSKMPSHPKPVIIHMKRYAKSVLKEAP
jgi:hypothetical protein